jgi:hypothetical protein
MAREQQIMTIGWPSKGINEDTPYGEQPPKTTRDCKNVRLYDTFEDRARGGNRGGLVRYVNAQANGTNRIQDIQKTTITTVSAQAKGALSNRELRVICVSAGKAYRFDSGSFVTIDANTALMDLNAPIIFSTEFFGGNIYYSDGKNDVYYNSSNNAIESWAASAGSLPANGVYRPRLIETWRGRIVESGLKNDPHNWFMSAVGDATDWDYAPTPETATQAIAGNNSLAGKVGDKINCLIPYSDDILIFGCDHTIWQMTGDPMEGGRIDQITSITGMSYGRPWTIDPQGTIYFFGSRGGVYRMAPGQAPERMSLNRIEQRLRNIDLDANIVRLEWDDRDIGVRVYITNISSDGEEREQYWWDARSDSWWADQYASKLFNPTGILSYDGDDATDRVLLLGGQDGYIRYEDQSSTTDDTEDLDTEVWIGPVQVNNGEIPFVIKEVQGILGPSSGDVSIRVYGSEAPEVIQIGNEELLLEDGLGFLLDEDGQKLLTETDANAPFVSVLDATRSVAHYPRVRGFAAYIKLSTTNKQWALERLHVKLSTITSSRGRRL